MSSFINKVASTVTNKTSNLVGRENLNKLTNGINKAFFVKSKYRDIMKHGNTIQLLSKNSHMSLQMSRSQNDPNRLVLFGNGQIGPQFTNTHWVIEVDPRNGHYKFRNGMNYLSFDQNVPCILTQPPIEPKDNKDRIRARNEFRLHELIGSDEHFALESVYYAGRYLSILPDGSVTVSQDKSLESTHFCVHIIHVYNQAPNNERPQSQIVQSASSYTVQTNDNPSNNANGSNDSKSDKELESQRAYNSNHAANGMSSASASAASSEVHADPPPNYTNLFPQLPK